MSYWFNKGDIEYKFNEGDTVSIIIDERIIRCHINRQTSVGLTGSLTSRMPAYKVMGLIGDKSFPKHIKDMVFIEDEFCESRVPLTEKPYHRQSFKMYLDTLINSRL